MKAHKAIDGVEDLKRSGRMDHEIADILTAKIAESQKFEFSFGDFPVFSADEMQSQLQEVRLPYPLCYLEIPTVGAVLAREHENALLVHPFLTFGGKVGTLPPEMMLLVDKRDGSICCHGDDPALQAEWRDPKDQGVIAVVSLICFAIRGLAVLNCSNVVCVENAPPSALNRKRMKSGRTPIYSYKTLHIKTNERKDPVQPIGSFGERHGPRLHLRRGHIRRLPSGSRTWVQSCMVGSMQEGMAMKEYRVT